MKPSTPLPWSVDEDVERFSLNIGPELNLAVAELWRRGKGESERQDAAYIVHACNTLPQLEAENARLRRALEFLEQFYERDGETNNDRFERIGSSFYKATGYLRPGKDCRMVSPGKRQSAWDKWIADGIAQVRAALRGEG